MLPRLFQCRSIWWPTPAGWALVLALTVLPAISWWFGGESFLARTDRCQADTLIVEGWIGYDGMSAAKAEFERGGYRQLMTVGGPTNNRWGRQRWNYAELAQAQLLRLGLRPDQIIAAPSRQIGNRRTFESAVAARDALSQRNPPSTAVNIFTLGIHARRSRMVFAKALPARFQVGSVAWHPPGYASEAWWKSGERAGDFIKESVGYFFELLLNSARASNSPPPGSNHTTVHPASTTTPAPSDDDIEE